MAGAGSPAGQALDSFLREQFKVLQYIRDNMPAILAVASHLTPVEDLADFQVQVEALYPKLGLLVEASEIMLSASDAGIDMLQAVSLAAQQNLLGLKSAAYTEASAYGSAAAVTQLQADLTALDVVVDALIGTVATKASTASVTALAARVTTLESNAGFNARIDALIADLENGVYFPPNLVDLATRLEAVEVGLGEAVARTTVLEAQMVDANAGIAANTSAVQTLTGRTETLEGTTTAHTAQLTQLDADLADLDAEVSSQATAINGLTVEVSTNGQNHSLLANEVTQLAGRVDNAETGMSAQASALEALDIRVSDNEEGLAASATQLTELNAALTSVGNLLPNSSFEINSRGWEIFSIGSGWAGAVMSRDMAPTVGTLPPATHSLCTTSSGGGVPLGNLGVRNTGYIAVEGQTSYMLSGYIAAENCTVRLEYRLYDSAGVEVGLGLIGSSTAPPPDALNEWPRISDSINIPVDAVQMQVQLWVISVTGVPKVWLLRPMLEQCVQGQINPSPWTDSVGGLETALSSAISELSAEVDNHDGILTAQAASITALDSRLDAGEITLAANSSALSALTTRVTETEGDISAMSSDLTALNTEVDGKASSAALEALDTRVDATETSITSQATQLTSLDASVSGLQGSTVAIANPSFEYEGDWGNAADNSTTLPTDIVYYGLSGSANALYLYSGRGSLWFKPNASGSRGVYNRAKFPVIAGQTIPVSFRCRTLAGTQPNAGSGVRLSCRWYDAAGVHLSNTHSPLVTSDGAATVDFTAGYLEYTHIAPTNAVLGQFYLQQVNVMGQGGFMVDDLRAQLPTIQGNANAQAISALDVRVTSNEGTLTAHAESIDLLEVTAGNNSASITQISSVQATLAANTIAIADPGFESTGKWGSAVGNTNLAATTAYQSDASSTDYVYAGKKSLRFNADAATRTVYNQQAQRVVFGKSYRITFWVRSWDGAPPAGAQIRATAFQRREDDTFVSHFGTAASLTCSGSAFGWTKVTGIYSPGALYVAKAFFAVQVIGLTSAALLVDEFIVEPIAEEVSAMWAVTLDVNGYASGFSSVNNGVKSAFEVAADTFKVTKAGGGDSLTWTGGVLSAVKGTNAVKLGAGFGSDTDKLIFYYGADGTDATRTLAGAKVGITASGKTKLAGTWSNHISGWDSGAACTATYNTASPATVTFNVTAGVFRTSGETINYNASSGTASQTRATTVTYYLYYTDGGMAGGSKTLGVSTDYRVQYNDPDKVYIGSVTVTVPASGSGTGGVTPIGSCPSCNAWVVKQGSGKIRAGEVRVGDSLLLSSGRWGKVTYSQSKLAPCVRVSGTREASLTCSVSAPLELGEGGHIAAANAAGSRLRVLYPVPKVLDKVVLVEEVGEQWVQHITCENDSFWVGDDPDWLFSHHNRKPDPVA